MSVPRASSFTPRAWFRTGPGRSSRWDRTAACRLFSSFTKSQSSSLEIRSSLPKFYPLTRFRRCFQKSNKSKFVRLKKGFFETPLVDNKECAYVVFGNNGTAQCGIENAHRGNAIDLKKPISCHLYPIRIKEYSEFNALNYHRWQICDSGCELGDSLKIPIYQFVKEALIRKFGNDWYAELEIAAQEINH